MILQVRHRTRYQYTLPQRMAIQSHRLYPSRCNSQTLISWDVTTSDGRFGPYFTDGAGDILRTLSVFNECDYIDIDVMGVVKTLDTNGVIQVKKDRMPTASYLVPTELTEPDEALTDLAHCATRDARSALDQAHAMMLSVAESIVYTPDSTTPHCSASDALSQGRGVCQDQTHCLLSIARCNNFPARYVTGYIHDPERGEGHGESHAWAELYIQNLGWVGFDSANLKCPDDHYIRIGSGLDSVDAALIRGVTSGAGEESLSTSVQIIQSQQ